LRAELAPHDAPAAPAGLAAGAYVRISVVDGGEGIPPEVLARVTEPFFTTKPRGKGTGLGLAMARGFAEQSGGGLTIESVLGRGTTVSLWLPQAGALDSGAVRDGEETPGVAVPGAAARVLLADDEADVREVLAYELEAAGFAVAQAEDAAAALALLDAGLRPDAMLTDLAMPGGIDGIGLIEEARRRWPRLPAVLVTGHAGDADASRVEQIERSGPFALVRKPAATEVLIERLSRVLSQGRPPGVGRPHS
jgi:CheY-like chemotaxis protein